MNFIPGARAIPDPEAETRRLAAARTWQTDSAATVQDFLDTVSAGDEITAGGQPRRVAAVTRDEHSITITLEPGSDA